MAISEKLRARLDALKATIPPLRVGKITREALRLPDPMTVTEWAEANVHLDARTSAEPGPFRVSRTPYLREPMDSFSDPLCEEIVICASTQVGKTLAEMLMLAYCVDQSPGPCLIVQADEKAAREILEERIVPLLRGSRVLRRHIPRGGSIVSKTRLRLDRMDVHLAWSNSPNSLASKPKQNLFIDEVDKYPKFSGREADPVKLAKERTRTYWNRKIVITSTPTTTDGYIWRAYLETDQRRFHAPCPHCGQEQPLEMQQIKWPEGSTAESIQRDRNVWYECIGCGEKITDRQKEKMVQAGTWIATNPASDGQPARKRGYWINAIYSPWLTFWEIAAEFHRCNAGGPEMMMNFVNSWLAQVWQEREAEAEIGRFAEIRRDYRACVVPREAVILTAGADVHIDNIYYVVRAWANNGESWLIDYGVLRRGPEYGIDDEFAALRDVVRGGYEVQGGATQMYISRFCIDRRYRKAEVDAFCRPFRRAAVPIMGEESIKGNPWMLHAVDKDRRGNAINKTFQYAKIDTTYFKGAWLKRYEGDEPGWWVPAEVDDEYQTQLLSEAKVVIGRDTRGEPKYAWIKKPGRVQNHFFDCEIYALAAFTMEGGERGALRGTRTIDSIPIPATATAQVASAPKSLGHSPGWNYKGKRGGRR